MDNIPYQYKWKWIETLEDHTIATTSSMFKNKDECEMNGLENRPSFDTWDGPNAPTLALCIIPYDQNSIEIVDTTHMPECCYNLERGIFFSILKIEEKIYFDIRRWKMNECGKRLPTTKGISLNLQQWLYLLEQAHEINKSIAEFKYNTPIQICGRIFVRSVGAKDISIEEWYEDEESKKMLPNHKYIKLSDKQWKALLKASLEIMQKHSELRTTVLCKNRDDHKSILIQLRCKECNPYEYIKYI